MEKVSLSQVNSVNFTSKQKKSETPNTTEPKKIDGKNKIEYALLALAALGAAGGAIGAVVSGKAQLEKAQTFFDQVTKATVGNNKVVSEALGLNKKEVDAMLGLNPKAYEALKQYIQSVISPKAVDEILTDGTLYHGTSIPSAVSILQNGITPYATKDLANKCPGLGRGVYTTPSADLAKHYSSSGVVLPFKLTGQVAELNVPDGDFRATVISALADIIEPDAKATVLGKMFSQQTTDKATSLAPDAINKVMQDLGYSGLYTPVGTTKGLLSNIYGSLPDNIDTAGQLAVFDGSLLELDTAKLKELNPITKDNMHKFLKFLGK